MKKLKIATLILFPIALVFMIFTAVWFFDIKNLPEGEGLESIGTAFAGLFIVLFYLIAFGLATIFNLVVLILQIVAVANKENTHKTFHFVFLGIISLFIIASVGSLIYLLV